MIVDAGAGKDADTGLDVDKKEAEKAEKDKLASAQIGVFPQLVRRVAEVD